MKNRLDVKSFIIGFLLCFCFVLLVGFDDDNTPMPDEVKEAIRSIAEHHRAADRAREILPYQEEPQGFWSSLGDFFKGSADVGRYIQFGDGNLIIDTKTGKIRPVSQNRNFLWDTPFDKLLRDR